MRLIVQDFDSHSFHQLCDFPHANDSQLIGAPACHSLSTVIPPAEWGECFDGDPLSMSVRRRRDRINLLIFNQHSVSITTWAAHPITVFV
jgi:hypothetical protein